MNETIDDVFFDREIERVKSVVASWDQWALACLAIERERMHPSDVEKFELAMARVKDAFSEFEKQIDVLRQISPAFAAHLYGLNCVMMDASMTMGGLALFSPSARQAFNEPFVKQRSDAGKKSGESRRANRPWVADATTLATEIGTHDLSLSQDGIATETIAGWKNHEVEPPGHATMKIHVAGLIRDGKIPARSRPKRSRPKRSSK